MSNRMRASDDARDVEDVTQAKASRAGGSAGERLAFEDNRPEADGLRQMQAAADSAPQSVQRRALQAGIAAASGDVPDHLQNGPRMVAQREAQATINRTGLPDSLKAGVETLSGMSMDHVRVHYNSSQPAQLNAHAFAQGSDIHLASGQEHHLPHEAWHVVQQAQDRVRPTQEVAGSPVNDDHSLENEADVMGSKALSTPVSQAVMQPMRRGSGVMQRVVQGVVQRVKVGAVEITKATPVNEIIAALGWTKYGGVTTKLSRDALEALHAELTGVAGCEPILVGITDAIEDLDEEGSASDGGDGEAAWSDDEDDGGDGQKAAVVADEDFVTPEEAAKRRKKAADDFGWTKYPDTIGTYTKLGVHETKASSIATLVQNGPSADKIDTGHGIGKGRGFYVTHVGQQQLYNAVKAITYEDNFVAVYIKTTTPRHKSPNEASNSVDELDKAHGGENCYYVMSGGSEIVIPARSFALVKIVASEADADALK